MPIADGGSHVMANVQLVCMEVNRMKGAMRVDLFLQLCREVVAYESDVATHETCMR